MSQRQDTCLGKPCPFWKKYKEFCPNYVTGTWLTNDGHEYETKDCAPKRSMILSQQLYDHITCARKDYNSMRNAAVSIFQIASQNNGIELVAEGEVVDAEEQKVLKG